MKKLLMLILALAFASNMAFAATSFKDEGTYVGEAVSIDSYGCAESFDGSIWTHDCRTISGTSALFTDSLMFYTNLIAAGRVGASTQVASSSTNLAPASLPWAFVYKNVGGVGSPDNLGLGTVLPNGSKPGQTITFQVANSPTGTWVMTPVTSTGWTNATFDAKFDSLTVTWINSTIGWIVTQNTAVTITAPLFSGN